jgi:putative ABC transport system permease protein
MVSLARRNLLHDRVRFTVTVAGVAFAVVLVLVQVGLFLGLLDKAATTIEHAEADIWVTSRNTPNVDFGHGFPDTVALRVRGVSGVARADNLIVAFMNVQLPTGAEESCQVYALADFLAWNLPWRVIAGDVTDLRRGPNIMMDRSAEKRFGAFAVGEYREILKRRFRIVGVTAEATSFTTAPIVFMDFRFAQGMHQFLHNRTSYVLVRVAPGADRRRVQEALRRLLPLNDVHLKEDWARRSRSYWLVTTGLGMNMAVTVLLGVLVGLVVVAQTLYASTVEHVREFGMVKAIGGSNADIHRILAEQAVIAALAGFALGALLTGVVRPTMATLGLTVRVPPPFLAAVFLGTVLMCLAAAALSFRRVAGIDPALVFRG